MNLNTIRNLRKSFKWIEQMIDTCFLKTHQLANQWLFNNKIWVMMKST